MNKDSKIQANKLKYQTPYFEVVEFDYSDIIQCSVCTNVGCPQYGDLNFLIR